MQYFLIFTLTFLFMPFLSVEAQQILTCTTAESCNFCQLVLTIDRVIGWLVTVAVLIAVIGLMWSGAKMVYSRGDVNSFTDAKKMFSNIVVGIIIIAVAWMVVDVIIKALAGGDMGVWNPPQECGGMEVIAAPTANINISNGNGVVVLQENSGTLAVTPGSVDGYSGAEGVLLGDMTAAPSSACPNCVSLASIGVDCKNASSCTIDQDYAERLAGLLNTQSDRMEVTEAFPPTRTHQASCHSNGTCVDIVFDDRNFTAARVQAFINRASAVGLRAVYEPARGGSCLGASNCVQNVATGNHFSLYAN